MDLQLDGKRALVTGASRGIGAATARALAGEGVVVAVAGRNLTDAEAVATSIDPEGAQAFPVTAELTDDSAVARLVYEVRDRIGGIDILVNNAGVFEHRTWATL